MISKIYCMPTNPKKSALIVKKHGTAEFISLRLWTANNQIKITAHAGDILLSIIIPSMSILPITLDD